MGLGPKLFQAEFIRAAFKQYIEQAFGRQNAAADLIEFLLQITGWRQPISQREKNFQSW